MVIQLSTILIFSLISDWSSVMTSASAVVRSNNDSNKCNIPYVNVGGQCILVRTPTSGPCTSPFTLVGDQCVYFATFAELNNNEAKQMCHSLDAELIIIDTPTRHKNIVDYIYANGLDLKTYWIDGTDQVMEDAWVFSSGAKVPMGTPFWDAYDNGHQKPDNWNDEDCLNLWTSANFYFNDGHCDHQIPCVCEQGRLGNKSDLASHPRPKLECPPFFVDVGGLCLAFMTWADQTWAEARQSCHGLGGELAAIDDIEHLRHIYSYIHEEGISSHSFWLGGSDMTNEGVWTWTDDTPVPIGTPFWGMFEKYIQEPDGGTNENCLLLSATGYHYFRDYSCDQLMNPLFLYSF